MKVKFIKLNDGTLCRCFINKNGEQVIDPVDNCFDVVEFLCEKEVELEVNDDCFLLYVGSKSMIR